MLKGHQSWSYDKRPVIKAAAACGGPFEAQGALAEDFDILHDDMWLGQDSFEKAEKNCWKKHVKGHRQSRTEKKIFSFFMAIC